MSTSRPALRRASLAVTSLAAVPMLAFGSWYAASPRLTLNAMQGAALSGDVGGFSDHVDYPALRQSLKSELRARITAEVDAAPRNSLKALGLAMAIGFVDPLVDNSISPEAVGLVIASLGQGNPLAGSPALESLSLLATPDLSIRRDGLDRFHVAVEGNAGSPELLFRREGWRWRLSGVDLDPVAPAPVPAA